ncbi:MAG: hypothetical protein ABIL52_04255 [candidate division WOR-3 bacterium]|jgi:hypothetical protein
MLFLIGQIVIDSVKDENLGKDALIKFLEPESLYVKISNRYYYFFMGYIPYEIKLPEGFYYIEYLTKKDTLFLRGGYIYNMKFPTIQTGKGKKVSYEYEIKKEFNRDLNRDSCYLVFEGGIDSIYIELEGQKIYYKLPTEFMFPAKKEIKIIAGSFEKKLFLEPQFIYYINIKSQ